MTEEATATVQNDRPYSLKKSIFFLCILLLSFVINAMDRQIFPMLLNWISKAYGFTLKDAGLLATIFTIGLAVAGIPAGFLLDRWSRKSVIVIGIVIYSIFTMATIYATGFWDMLIYRALTGVGEGMQMAALYVIIGSYFYKDKALAIGGMILGFGLGSFVSPWLGAKLMLATGNWHTPFIVYTVVGFVIAVIVWIILPRPFCESRGPVKENNADAANLAAIERVPAEFWNRNLIMVAVAAALLGSSFYGYVSLYTTYLIRALQYTPEAAGIAFGTLGFGSAATSLIAGWLGDRFPQRWIIALAYVTVVVDGYLMYNTVSSLAGQMACSFVMGAALSGFLNVNCSSFIQRCVRPDMVGRASGVFVTVHFTAGAIAGYLFGLYVEVFSWGMAGIIHLSICPLVAIIAMLFIREDQLFLPAKK